MIPYFFNMSIDDQLQHPASSPRPPGVLAGASPRVLSGEAFFLDLSGAIELNRCGTAWISHVYIYIYNSNLYIYT